MVLTMISIVKAKSPILMTKFADFGQQIRRFWSEEPYLRHQETLPSASGNLTFGIRKS